MPALVPSATTRSALTATHLLHTPESFVRVPLPGLTNGEAIVHACPRLGAEFVWMTIELAPGGTLAPGVNSRFFYVLEGQCTISQAGVTTQAGPGTYAYSPTIVPITLTAVTATRCVVLDKKYEPLAGVLQTSSFVRREQDVAGTPLGGDPTLMVRALMPPDAEFDFAVNTMSYAVGALLAQVEVHSMEHGLLMLEGEGMYLLDKTWYPVRAGDFVWMAPYCPQWFVAGGAVPAKYLIYKNFNRMPEL